MGVEGTYMTHGFRTRVGLGVVALGIALAAWPLSANHSWGNYHWARTANPFTLAVGDNVSGVWDSHLDTAVADWAKSAVLDLQPVAGTSRGKNCKATTGRIEVCNGAYGTNGWLGIARISVSGTHITAATTRVNDSYFNSAPYNTAAWRQLVMCQEVGHDFGLDHQDENFDNPNLGTCMDYTSNPTSNQHPNQHDYDQLLTIYAHLDSTSTVGSLVPVTAQDAQNEPEAWGRLIRSTRNGREHIYELDLGNGRRIYTHVFWADAARDQAR
jgi:hypothetical protein